MSERRKTDIILFFIALFLPWIHFLSVFPITPQPFLFFLSAFLLSAGYTLLLEKQRLPYLWALLLAMMLFLLLINRNAIFNAVNYAYNQITEVYASHSSYFFAALPVAESPSLSISGLQLLLSIFLLEMMLLYHCLVKRCCLFTAFCCTFALFFPSLLYSSPLPWPITLCLFAFWGILLFSSFGRKKKIIVDGRHERRLYTYIGSCILIFCIAMLLVFPPQHYEISVEKTQMRDGLLNYLKMTSYDLLNGKEEEGEVDLNRAGNRYYTGEEQFTVQRERSAILYVKTLSTSQYEDNAWSVLPQEDYEQSSEIAWNRLRTWIGGYTRQEGNTEKETITIYDKRLKKQYALEPYYLYSIQQKSGIYYDAYTLYTQQENDTFRYEMWNASAVENTYLPAEDSNAYLEFVKEHYLQLPDELRTLFEDELELLDAAFLYNDTKEIINYIREYLKTNASYTLTPGSAPQDKDFISWFLTEHHEGYCVHFASSAAMMLRYYGIPCRYVQGYRIDGFDMKHKGTAYDRDAHAWVEIFTPEQGWIPVEFTPGFKEGADQSTMNKTALTEKNEPQQIQDPDSDRKENKDTPAEREGRDTQSEENQELVTGTSYGGKNTGKESFFSPYVCPLTILFLFLLLLIGQRKLRFHRREKRLYQKDRRKAAIAWHAYMQAVLHGRDMEDPRFEELYEKAIYSRQGITEEEYAEMVELAKKRKKELFRQLGLLEKGKLRYLRALD